MQRVAFFGVVLFAIAKSWLVWILLLPWGLLGIYDLLVSQFVSEAEAKGYPKAFMLLGQLVNWMPWWGWLIGLLVIFVIGVLEYVFKTHKALALAAPVPRPIMPPAVPTPIAPVENATPQQAATTHGAHSPINQLGPVTGSQIFFQPVNAPTHGSEQQILPDMLIRDLWEHVSPEIGPTAHFQHIGKELIDAFSLGKVRVWGRRFVNDRSDGALESIDADYWPCAKLSMWFLSAEKQRNTQHTYNVRPYVRANGQLVDVPYADLRVNREQALSVWPSVIPMQPIVLGFDGDGVRFSMREAAQTVFDSSRGTVSYGWVITTLDDPEERLAYFASYICRHVRVIGVVPPSTRDGNLDPAPFLDGGTFSDGGNTFTRQGSSHPTYTGISVSEKSLNEAIQKLKATNAQLKEESVGSPPSSAPTFSAANHGASSPVTQIGAINNSTVNVHHGVNPVDDSALGNHLEYSKWTTAQLKAETRKIVAAMQTLQLERDVQLSHANRIVPGETQQQRLVRRACEIGAIDAPILAKHGVMTAPHARAMFISLTFKLGRSYAPGSVDRLIGEQAITGYAVNGEVIKNGADYLEKLAHRLS